MGYGVGEVAKCVVDEVGGFLVVCDCIASGRSI